MREAKDVLDGIGKIVIDKWSLPSSEEFDTTPSFSIFDKVGTKIVLDIPQLKNREMATPSVTVTRLLTGKTVAVVAVNHYDLEVRASKSTLIFVDIEAQAVIFSRDYEEVIIVDGVAFGRVLIRKQNLLDFFSVDTNQVLDTFNFDDLSGSTEADLITKFDSARKQFAIFSPNLDFVQLMEFSTDPEMTTPRVVNRGSAVTNDLSRPSIEHALINNGILFAVSTHRVPVASEDNPEVSTVVACDLKSSPLSGNLSCLFI